MLAATWRITSAASACCAYGALRSGLVEHSYTIEYLMYDAITVAAGSSQNKKTASARSDGRQGGRRPGLQAQRRALAAACRRRGWQPLERAARSATERARPGSTPLLATEQAEDTTLAASTLARPEQALLELAALVTSAQRQGWALTALHCSPEAPPTDQELAAVQATSPPATSSRSPNGRGRRSPAPAPAASASAARRRCPRT